MIYPKSTIMCCVSLFTRPTHGASISSTCNAGVHMADPRACSPEACPAQVLSTSAPRKRLPHLF